MGSAHSFGSSSTGRKKEEIEEEWKEVTTSEGLKYYYNVQTRETRWEKPKTTEETEADEKQLNANPTGPVKTMQIGPWVEYKTPEGRSVHNLRDR